MVEDKKPAEDDGKNSGELEAVVEVEEVRDDRGRFVVEDKKPEVKVEEPKPAPKAKPEVKVNNAAVQVSVSALAYSQRKRKSLSVGLLQDRLAVLGYASARSDLRGWFHDGTKAAVEKWQKDNGLDATGACSLEDAEFLFDGEAVKFIA
jgi:peptidoglycan hydrolase-like protein with peptidoglycan-binding domain